MSTRAIWVAAACLGLFGVALGAFGAHALKDVLLANGRTDTFELAMRYLLYHALALFVIGLLHDRFEGAGIRIAGVLLLAGVLVFSSSLMVLALFEWRSIALVTPVGGLLMLAGWAMLIYVIATGRNKA